MSKMAAILEEARRVVLVRLESIMPLHDVPRVLWWMGVQRNSAFLCQERLGLAVARAMEAASSGAASWSDFVQALDTWIEAIEIAKAKTVEHGVTLGPRPIWCFWSCYSERDAPESHLSKILREEVGLPTDAEAGIAAPLCATAASAQRLRSRRSDPPRDAERKRKSKTPPTPGSVPP